MNAVNDKITSAGTEKTESIGFKMVTFSLAGKDYSIDIMKVGEISKANHFTYVPNSLPYVRGVYNLRGDIISIIDLRKMFNLQEKVSGEKQSDEIIVLKLDDYLIGVIVDSIDKVVEIAYSTIQPPHPIFGDINIKFIQGVVEKDGKLYLILDVERIFGFKTDDMDVPNIEYIKPDFLTADKEELGMSFVSETLKTFKKFNVADLNNRWIEKRFDQWKDLKGNSPEALQLHSEADADEFLSRFYSMDTGRFWSNAYRDEVSSIIGNNLGGTIRVWNPGCGMGYETYSLASLLSGKFKNSSLKVWANDNDLISISNAPNLILDKQSLPEYMDQHIIQASNGYQISKELKDITLFEYHDLTHPNTFPEVDIIVARDILSFLDYNEQLRITSVFLEKLKPGGILIIGDNEQLFGEDWQKIESMNVSAYRKAV